MTSTTHLEDNAHGPPTFDFATTLGSPDLKLFRNHRAGPLALSEFVRLRRHRYEDDLHGPPTSTL